MKIRRIEREISQNISVGGFDSIRPTMRMIADLDEGEDPEVARKALDAVLEDAFNKTSLSELRAVQKRRNGEVPKDDRVPGLFNYFKTETTK